MVCHKPTANSSIFLANRRDPNRIHITIEGDNFKEYNLCGSNPATRDRYWTERNRAFLSSRHWFAVIGEEACDMIEQLA